VNNLSKLKVPSEGQLHLGILNTLIPLVTTHILLLFQNHIIILEKLGPTSVGGGDVIIDDDQMLVT
jgi:hypothetical protein